MSTAQTWTLWQRMPPRYQLTTQCFVDDDDDDFALVGKIDYPNKRPKSRRSPRSPRPYSGKIISKPTSAHRTIEEFGLNKRSWSHKEDFMLSANVPEQVQCEISTSVQQQTSKNFSFPRRHSDYVSTFQKQCRVNSARRRLAEMPPSPNRPSTPTTESTSPREHTLPAFAVTSIDNFKDHRPKLIDRSKINGNLLHVKAKPIGEAIKVDFLQFDDSKSVSSTSSGQWSRFADSKLKKYVVQDTNRATLYNDNGKVMYFGKSRHDLTNLLKAQSIRADRNTCFLAEIRRDYLKHPKYDRSRHLQRHESDPKQIANERVDYNRRVEHILSYYDENVRDVPNSTYRPTSGYRCWSPKGSRIKGLSLTPPAPSRPQSRSASPIADSQEICSDFIKLNKQSKLHDRQFYHRTLGVQQSVDISELETCKCSMCRMELQLNLVTMLRSTNSGIESCIVTLDECKPPGDNFEDMNIKAVADENICSSLKLHKSSTDSNMNQRNAQTVASPQPELVTKPKEPRYTISCTLPEVDVMAVSEPGLESSRTHDANVTCRNAVGNEQ